MAMLMLLWTVSHRQEEQLFEKSGRKQYPANLGGFWV